MLTAGGRLLASIAGTIAVAICCFTPILLTALAIIGLGALTKYLDYVLIPALLVMLIVTWRAYHEYVRSQHGGDVRS